MAKKSLNEIIAETKMTREQIKGVITEHFGCCPPETNMNSQEQADQRLANLYEYMREQQSYHSAALIDTVEKARRLRLLIKKHSPIEIRDSWDDPRTVQILDDGSIQIDNPLPEAKIFDVGGMLRRKNSMGEDYEEKIQAQHYVGKAIEEYNATDV